VLWRLYHAVPDDPSLPSMDVGAGQGDVRGVLPPAHSPPQRLSVQTASENVRGSGGSRMGSTGATRRCRSRSRCTSRRCRRTNAGSSSFFPDFHRLGYGPVPHGSDPSRGCGSAPRPTAKSRRTSRFREGSVLWKDTPTRTLLEREKGAFRATVDVDLIRTVYRETLEQRNGLRRSRRRRCCSLAGGR
jgi:hypothetical protein